MQNITFMHIFGYIFLSIGSIFLFLGALGIVRMPDNANKLQAGTKATTLGFLAFAAGLFFFHPEWWAKLLLISFFILLTNPIGSHTIARASINANEPLIIKGYNMYKEKEQK